MNRPVCNDEARITNDEGNSNVQMTKRSIDTVLVNSGIRHSALLMAQVDQSATNHPVAACNESDRATGLSGPARIQSYLV
jgi:hypothetical protein